MNEPSRQFSLATATSVLLAAGLLIPVANLHAGRVVQAWVQRYPGASGTKIGVDPEGNVIVAAQLPSWKGLVIKYSSSGTALWTNIWGSQVSVVQGMAIDNSRNVYVAGYWDVPMQTPPDYITTAYSSDGTPLWTNSYNRTYTYPMPVSTRNADDRATGVAVDGNGNVYVSGVSATEGIIPPAIYTTLAYSNSGTLVWTNSSETWGPNYPAAVAVDSRNNVYVAGTHCDGGQSCSPGYIVVAYSNAGIPLWTRACNSYLCSGTFQAMAVDSVGDVYVAASWYGYLTVAISSGGTPLWQNSYPSPLNANDSPCAVAVGSNGNVYVTGYSLGTNTGYDYATLAYSSLGIPLWTNRYNGPGNSNDCAQALAVGGSGNVYVTGYSWGASGSYDYLTIAYSTSGLPLWTNRYNGPGGSQASALAVDRNDNLYVTGTSGGDCVTIKYMPAPEIQFTGIDPLPGAAWRLTLTAPTNVIYRLEASSNLANWLTLTNYTNLPVTSVQYTDTPAPGFSTRFYRAVWVP
jgi:hypothetical protein